MVQHAAADTLQIRLPNGDEVQNEGRVTLEASIEKLQVTFDAHILNTYIATDPWRGLSGAFWSDAGLC